MNDSSEATSSAPSSNDTVAERMTSDPPFSASVALQKCADTSPEIIHAAVKKILDDTPEFDRVVRPNKRVFLKVNLVTNAAREDGICTDPEVVRAVVTEVKKRGAIAVVGDNPAIASTSSVLKSSGIADVLRELEVEVPDMSQLATLTCDRGINFKEFQVSKAILDADVLINLPKLKTHALTYMSMATKNLFGVIPGTRKARWHVKAPHGNMMAGLFNDLYSGIADVFRSEGRGLIHLCDGITALEGDGPGHSGRPKFLGALLCSTDAVALDRVGVEIAGLDASKLITLQKAIQRNLGTGDLSKIAVVGAAIADFQDVNLVAPSTGGFRLEGIGIRLCNLSWIRALTTDHPMLLQPEDCIGCRRCAEICPANAIRFDGDKAPTSRPRFHISPCIRCYCCAEVCPKGAITKSEVPLLGRLLRRL